MLRYILTLMIGAFLCSFSTNLSANQSNFSKLPTLNPIDVDSFWVEPRTPSILRWELTDNSDLSEVTYEIKDYLKATIEKGTAQVTDRKTLEIEVNLPGGYYEIQFPELKLTFGVMSIAEFSGEEDPFFGIDCAMSWLSRGDRKASREPLIKVLKRSGIGYARERMHWGSINPKPGKFDWNKDETAYEDLLKLYKKHDVQVLDVFHEAPKWSGAGNRYANKNPFPKTLLEGEKNWQTILKRWAPYWFSLEIWNEPDIGFSNRLPADQYTPIVKVISWLKSQYPEYNTELIGGVYASDMTKVYHDGCSENGMLNFIDGVSFHSYNVATAIENSMRKYRQWLKKSDKESMPIWITECGWSWKGGKPRPIFKRGVASAAHIAMKVVEAKACGVARHFPFVYVYYDEKSKNFGMMGKWNTPLRAMASYSYTVSLLAHKEYIGDLKTSVPNIKRARVFTDKNGDDAVIVIFTGQTEKEIDLSGLSESVSLDKVYGIDGRALNTDKKLLVKDGMIYIKAKLSNLQQLISKDTEAMRLLKISQRPFAKRAQPSPIVINPRVSEEKTYYHLSRGYYIEPGNAGSLPLTIPVFNLGETEKELLIDVSIQLEDESVKQLFKQNITLKGRSKAEFEYSLDISEELNGSTPATIIVTAREDGANVDQSIMKFYSSESEEAEVLPANSDSVWIDINKANDWTTMGGDWKGPEDLSAKLAFHWSKNELNINVKAIDDKHQQDFADDAIWRGDSIQIAIQKLRTDGKPTRGLFNELSIGMTKDGVKIYRHGSQSGRKPGLIPSEKSKAKRVNNQTIYDIYIPLDELDLGPMKNGEKLGFSFLINDNDDGSFRKGYIHWGEGIGSSKQSLEFFKIKFVDKDITPISAESLWISPGKEQEISWESSDVIQAGSKYIVTDYHGNVCFSGQGQKTGENMFSTALKLDRGYYEIKFANSSTIFGIVALESFEDNTDSFFCIDAALSWLSSGEEAANREPLIRIMKRIGITMSRERVSWKNINPAPDKWDWEGRVGYDSLRKLYAKHNLKILEVFHDAPAWTGAERKKIDRHNPYPQKLGATAKSWEAIAKRWGHNWGGLEVWNEPDISFGGRWAADQYLPLAKALAFQKTKSNWEFPLAGGCFARPTVDSFEEGSGQNKLMQTVECLSFHSYLTEAQMEKNVADYRKLAEDFDNPSIPIWITESGRSWVRGTNRPIREQGKKSALDIILKGIEAKACGVSKYFPFILVYYDENIKNFGMMDDNVAPLRSIAAYAWNIKALANSEYIGDWESGSKAIKRCRVFKSGDQAIIAVSKVADNKSLNISCPFNITNAAGIDGRKITVGENNSLDIKDGLVYIYTKLSDIQSFLTTDTKAMELLKKSQMAQKEPSNSPLIIKPQITGTNIFPGKSGYIINKLGAGMMFSALVENISDEEQECELVLDASANIKHSPNVPKIMTIPPQTTMPISWWITFSPEFDILSDFRLTIKSTDPKLDSMSASSCFKINDYNQIINRVSNKKSLPIDQVNRWRKNSTPGATSTLEKRGQSLVIKANFQEHSDKWSYPRYELKEEGTITNGSMFLVQFSTEKTKRLRMILWEKDGSMYLTESYVPEINKSGHFLFKTEDFKVFPSSKDENGALDLDQISHFSFGFNTVEKSDSLTIDNIYYINRD